MSKLILLTCALFLLGCNNELDRCYDSLQKKSENNDYLRNENTRLINDVQILRNMIPPKSPPSLMATECVAFEKDKFDTHAGGLGDMYTIVTTGTYAWIDPDGKTIIDKRYAGEMIKTTVAVKDSCGQFYQSFVRARRK